MADYSVIGRDSASEDCFDFSWECCEGERGSLRFQCLSLFSSTDKLVVYSCVRMTIACRAALVLRGS